MILSLSSYILDWYSYLNNYIIFYFYTSCFLPEDGRVTDQNMQEILYVKLLH
jgi:hypothetical protein